MRAAKRMDCILYEALLKQPNTQAYKEAAKQSHLLMFTCFPKATPRNYENALVEHAPSLLGQGSLLDGSSWILEALNKLWKNKLL
jgi:hypothetical protein